MTYQCYGRTSLSLTGSRGLISIILKLVFGGGVNIPGLLPLLNEILMYLHCVHPLLSLIHFLFLSN